MGENPDAKNSMVFWRRYGPVLQVNIPAPWSIWERELRSSKKIGNLYNNLYIAGKYCINKIWRCETELCLRVEWVWCTKYNLNTSAIPRLNMLLVCDTSKMRCGHHCFRTGLQAHFSASLLPLFMVRCGQLLWVANWNTQKLGYVSQMLHVWYIYLQKFTHLLNESLNELFSASDMCFCLKII